MPSAEHKWPERPYPGLKSYRPEDLALFTGRDADVTEFVDVLGQFPSRVLLLHGITGAGKTSFLRAAVIPFLSGEGPSFHFLEKGSGGQERTALFVRSTDAPLLQVAESVQNFAAQGFVLVTPSGKQDLALRGALLGHNSALSFREEVARAPLQLVHALSSLAEVLPGTLVLVLDQAEEVITLNPGADGDESRSTFFEFLAEFAATELDVKLIISLRTEYYGRYRHEMHEAGVGSGGIWGIRDYYLRTLGTRELVDAIVRPTSNEPFDALGSPRDFYRFRFEDELPVIIASDLSDATAAGGVLPVLQIVCGRLYESIARSDAEERLITAKAYSVHGGVAGQIEAYVDEVLLQHCRRVGLLEQAVDEESEKWKRILAGLAREHADGSVISEFVTHERLLTSAATIGCAVDAGKMMASLCDEAHPLCRRVNSIRRGTDEVLNGYSLGSDAIGLALLRWQEGTQVPPRRRPRGLDETDMVERILNRQHEAREVVIVNPDTLEASQHPRAEEFQHAMFHTILNEAGRFTFILHRDDTDAALRHWRATLVGLAKFLKLDRTDPDTRSQAVNLLVKLEAEGKLVVKGAEKSICVIRVVAFDPSRAERCEVYVWDWWQEGGEILNDGALLSPSATRRWVNDLYVPILVEQLPVPGMRFEHVKSRL